MELIGLPAKSRAVLAHKLIESLEEDEPRDATREWIEEAKRRIKDFDEGRSQGIPAEDVFRELEEEFGYRPSFFPKPAKNSVMLRDGTIRSCRAWALIFAAR
jgi:putative addiction module component (TIGR02574 family)